MKNRIPFGILIIVSVLFIFTFYSKILLHANQYLFCNGGDAIKNYYTYCYHIKHDKSFVEFNGMNFPYGENFLYTDCHPVLSNIFKVINGNGTFISSHAVGLLNFIMIFSILITFFVCYFLLLECRINRWIGLLFSLGITILAPQIFRLGGHLALSYSVAIPLSWLWLLKSRNNPQRWIYVVLLLLNNLFWLYIHAYLGMIIIAFLGCFVMINFLLDKERYLRLVEHSKLIGAVIVPVLFFYAFAHITDIHTNRTNNPYGFLDYSSEFDDIFVPTHQPLRPYFDMFVNSVFKTQINQNWEAWSYVGFSTSIVFVVFCMTFLITLLRRKKQTVLSPFFTSDILNISLLSAVIVLLFSMAFPFRTFPKLLEILPILKQFRATGRFTWPFYFVSIVFTASVFQKMYELTSVKWKKIAIAGLCVFAGGLTICEGLPYHSEVSQSIIQSNNLFKLEYASEKFKSALQKIDVKSYQAIITLPFYYQGSENFSRPRYDETMRTSMILSYHTGLPMFSTNLTRTGIFESRNIIQMVSPDYYKKAILKDLKSDKPFLVLRTRDSITNYEREIFKKCTPLFVSDEISVYKLSKEDLFKSSAQLFYNKYIQQLPNLHPKGQFLVSNDSSFFYYNSFEDKKSEKCFRGHGGFQSVKKGKNPLVDFPAKTFVAGKKYHISVWMYNAFQDALNMSFQLKVLEYDKANDKWYETQFGPDFSEEINGNWSLVEGDFVANNSESIFQVITQGKDNEKVNLYVDDLLIKEVGTESYFYDKKAKNLFYNNHFISLK